MFPMFNQRLLRAKGLLEATVEATVLIPAPAAAVPVEPDRVPRGTIPDLAA